MIIKFVSARGESCEFCGGVISVYECTKNGKKIYFSKCNFCKMLFKGDIRNKDKSLQQDIENLKYFQKGKLMKGVNIGGRK